MEMIALQSHLSGDSPRLALTTRIQMVRQGSGRKEMIRRLAELGVELLGPRLRLVVGVVVEIVILVVVLLQWAAEVLAAAARRTVVVADLQLIPRARALIRVSNLLAEEAEPGALPTLRPQHRVLVRALVTIEALATTLVQSARCFPTAGVATATTAEIPILLQPQRLVKPRPSLLKVQA
jgi:hypothetical protein